LIHACLKENPQERPSLEDILSEMNKNDAVAKAEKEKNDAIAKAEKDKNDAIAKAEKEKNDAIVKAEKEKNDAIESQKIKYEAEFAEQKAMVAKLQQELAAYKASAADANKRAQN